MRPVTINGRTWGVTRVNAGDARLVDRTGRARLATTDPTTDTIWIDSSLTAPMLDRVVLHEVAHAIAISWGLLDGVVADVPRDLRVPVEEWSAQMMENHAIEAIHAASAALGRPVCVRGLCA